MTRKKDKYFKILLKEGDWTFLDTFFHDDYFFLKDHTLINQDDHMMTCSYESSANKKITK